MSLNKLAKAQSWRSFPNWAKTNVTLSAATGLSWWDELACINSGECQVPPYMAAQLVLPACHWVKNMTASPRNWVFLCLYAWPWEESPAESIVNPGALGSRYLCAYLQYHCLWHSLKWASVVGKVYYCRTNIFQEKKNMLVWQDGSAGKGTCH